MYLDKSLVKDFQETVWDYYRQNGRSMPWRDDPTPYKVLVSELMLQQTQVGRVIPKFDAFLYTCDSFASLAEKPLSTVLQLWSGLGYNRRAKFLHQTAQFVMRDYGGKLPDTREELVKLPGIGANTAGAIMAYAFNKPVVFIETNIRSVYFHYFFTDTTEKVTDKQLELLVEQTLDEEHPREWYWALMDYGTHLKHSAGGKLETSTHYVKQGPLKGSAREMRGWILKALTQGTLDITAFDDTVRNDSRFEAALSALRREGLIEVVGEKVRLTGYEETS